jgi:hypothetical protein
MVKALGTMVDVVDALSGKTGAVVKDAIRAKIAGTEGAKNAKKAKLSLWNGAGEEIGDGVTVDDVDAVKVARLGFYDYGWACLDAAYIYKTLEAFKLDMTKEVQITQKISYQTNSQVHEVDATWAIGAAIRGAAR